MGSRANERIRWVRIEGDLFGAAPSISAVSFSPNTNEERGVGRPPEGRRRIRERVLGNWIYRWRLAGIVGSFVLIWGALLGQTESAAPAQPTAREGTSSSGGTIRGVVRNGANHEPV